MMLIDENKSDISVFLMKDALVLCFLPNVKHFLFMNLLLISKFLLTIFCKQVSFGFILILCLNVHCCICLFGMDVGEVGMRLLWYDFEVFLHHLHLHWMAVNDLVCLVCF